MSFYLLSQITDLFKHVIPCVVAGSIVHYLLLCMFFTERTKFTTLVHCLLTWHHWNIWFICVDTCFSRAQIMKVEEWIKLPGKLSFRNAENGITLSHSEEWYSCYKLSGLLYNGYQWLSWAGNKSPKHETDHFHVCSDDVCEA